MRRTRTQLKVAAAFMAAPDAHHYGWSLCNVTGVTSSVLYPMLHRFEEARFIAGAWESVDPRAVGRPPRRYYTVTPAGRKAMAELLEPRQATESRTTRQ